MTKSKSSNKSSQFSGLVIGVVMFIFVAGIILSDKKKPATNQIGLRETADEISQRVHLRKIVDGHLKTHKLSIWLITNAPSMSTPELVMLCTQQHEALIRSMHMWCPTNQVGLAIRAWVPEWGWSVVGEINTQRRMTMQVVIGGNQLIMLVPQAITWENEPSFFCSKEKDGRVIFVQALKLPEHIFAAFVLHEIGHAQQYWREGKTPDSIYEVEMHVLSFEILNNYSGGKYETLIEEIVNREQSRLQGDFKNIYRYLNADDMVKLDKVIGATDIGKKAETSVVVQHLLSLGFKVVDRLGGGLVEKKIVYQWVNQQGK